MNGHIKTMHRQSLADRDLWRPDRNEQMAAIEILLASSIPTELRRLLREREFALATRKDAA